MKITNDRGRSFLVRVVYPGDRYGHDDCLIHDEKEPLIEFYDLTHACTASFGERGQFVSRYYASSLADADRTRGLLLHGAEPEAWSINRDAMVPVWDLARDIADKYPRQFPRF